MHPETATINRISHHVLIPSAFVDDFKQHLQRTPLHGDPLRFSWYLVDCFVAGQRHFVLIQRDWGYLVLLDGSAEDSIAHLPIKLLADFQQTFLDDDNAELPDYALASLELDPDAVTWSVAEDISHKLLQRLKAAVEQVAVCADIQTASYAVESLNLTPINLNGQEYCPEEAFADMLADLEGQFEDYWASTGTLRRVWHMLTGNRPWMAG